MKGMAGRKSGGGYAQYQAEGIWNPLLNRWSGSGRMANRPLTGGDIQGDREGSSPWP